VSATTNTSGFDSARAEAFSGRFLTTLNDGALCLMTSVGHRAGLFDAMSALPPATAEDIAARAGLNPRYVREWLGAMVTAGVVEVDPTSTRYVLPAEHASFLTRAAGADNLAVFAQYIALLGTVEDDIVECFRKGGGVPYARFGRFHDIMAEDSGQSVLSSLESHVLDLSPEAIGTARDAAARAGLGNVDFVVRDLSDFDETAEPQTFDLITTFDAIHDQAKPLNVLKGIHRALKPDGVYLMQDIRGSSHVHNNIGHPIGTFLYAISTMHCMTVSLAQGGEGLGAMWGEEKTREYLEKAGFRSIVTHQLAHDIQNNWYVVGK
jgi:2-polyprenyl-3-methyl-5-hydroxy-6-metoxy-1,4-benzoquinol methylase